MSLPCLASITRVCHVSLVSGESSSHEQRRVREHGQGDEVSSWLDIEGCLTREAFECIVREQLAIFVQRQVALRGLWVDRYTHAHVRHASTLTLSRSHAYTHRRWHLGGCGRTRRRASHRFRRYCKGSRAVTVYVCMCVYVFILHTHTCTHTQVLQGLKLLMNSASNGGGEVMGGTSRRASRSASPMGPAATNASGRAVGAMPVSVVSPRVGRVEERLVRIQGLHAQCMYICACMCLSVCLSVCPSVCLSLSLSSIYAHPHVPTYARVVCTRRCGWRARSMASSARWTR